MQSWISILFLCLYIIDVLNVINAIRLDIRKYYAVTKSLLLPLLLITYLLFLPKEFRILSYQKFAILALIFHWIGDVLLLFPKDKTKLYFYIGTLSFFTGHIFFIFLFAQSCWSHSISFLIIASVVALILEIILCTQLIKVNKKLGIALSFYSLGLAILFVTTASTKNILATLGVLSFWFSDYIIARRELKMKTLGQMPTMVTYMLAQTLIILGVYIYQL